MKIVKLDRLTNNGEVRNLSGHERGQAARKLFGLDALDSDSEQVVVAIPDFVYSITPSFFQGMFAESVRKFGSRERFLNRYAFDAEQNVLRQIDNGIQSSLTRRQPLL